MRLIDEGKAKEAKNRLEITTDGRNGFYRGVLFAENELKNLAIEFALWYHLEKNLNPNIEISKKFNEFIQQRKKK